MIKNDFDNLRKTIIVHKKNSRIVRKSEMSSQLIHNDLHPKNIIMRKIHYMRKSSDLLDINIIHSKLLAYHNR